MKTETVNEIADEVYQEMFLQAEEFYEMALTCDKLDEELSFDYMVKAKRIYFFLGIENYGCNAAIDLFSMFKNESAPAIPNPRWN